MKSLLSTSRAVYLSLILAFLSPLLGLAQKSALLPEEKTLAAEALKALGSSS